MQFRKFKIGLIDRYIMGKFIKTYVLASLLLVVVVIVFDASEKIDDFMELNAPLSEIFFTYYLNFIPFFINQFSSLIVFLSVIFFTSKLAYNTEIVAVLSSGVSFRRFVYPYFISATLITMLSLALNLYIIPHANSVRIEFEASYLKKGKRGNYDSHIYRQVDDSTFVYIKGYNSLNSSCQFLVIETIQNNIITASITAGSASFDKDTKHWKAEKYIERRNVNGSEVLEKLQKLDTMINLSDTELGKVENHIQTLNINDLNKFIEEQKRKGSNLTDLFLVDMHNRYAYPLSAMILTLIGVSLSSRKVRGGIGLQLVIGVGLCFSYILFMRFATEFAKGGVLPPFIAVWLPNIMYTVIALYLYRTAPK